MTAQIRPNRMEVSDRFPMLGFAVRTDQPDVEAEVVIASDIALFSPQKRSARTAANFYSSREHGSLRVPRGEGVFVVPPEVLARFIGNDRLFFGLATGRASNGGLHVDALPREGSPYVSLRGFTGRTLRRGFGAAPATTPTLEWTGDAPAPGSEAANGASATPQPANASANGNGANSPRPVPAPYDDGFGPMPDIPARESAFRGAVPPRANGGNRVGITMDAGTTADRAVAWLREKIEQGVQAAGHTVSPPSIYYLGDASSTFTSAWQVVFGVTSLFSPVNAFLASIPSLARRLDVTLSIGPALDTPLFGGGVGAVFAPDGQVALFGQGEISADLDSLTEFASSLKLALAAKMKLGYNRGGLASFADISTVAGLMVGEEIVGGSEIWLDSSGSGIGGAVSIGVGFALQLAVQNAPVRPARFATARQLGLPASTTAITMGSGTTARQALDWIMEKVEQVVGAVGDDVSPPSLYRLGSDSSTFVSAWETVLGAAGWLPGGAVAGFLAEIPALARSADVTLSIGPALDTPLFGGGVGVVFAPDGQVALFGQGEISVDFDGLSELISSLKASLQAKLKLGYNRGGIDGFASLRKVGSVAVGEEIVVGAEIWLDGSGSGIGGAVSIGVGFALQLAAQEAENVAVMPALPGDPRTRATRIGGEFAPRIAEALDLGLDASSILPLLDKLDPPVVPPKPELPAAPAAPQGLASRAHAAQKIPANALQGGGGASAADWIQAGVAVFDTVNSISQDDISCQVDKFDGWHRPQHLRDQPLRDRRTSVAVIEWDDGGILDAIGLKLRVRWEHDGWSVGNVVITPFGLNDAVGDSLAVTVKITPTSEPFNGMTMPYLHQQSDETQTANPADYIDNPGAQLLLTITYQRGRMVRNAVTEGTEVKLLPTGHYTEVAMALD